ncbi:hypothetical protein GCM10027082_24540 [Comamonas humi]
MKEKQVWYEPHPVSPERKAELRAKGFQIIDVAFMPEGYENPADEGEPEGAKKATVAELRAAAGKIPEDEERAMLIAALLEQGVDFDESLPTDELRALTITPAQPQDTPAKRGRKPAQPQE